MIKLPPARIRPGGIALADARQLVRFIRYWRPLTIEADDVGNVRHPWQISGRWDPEQERWECQVYWQSYVNGQEVLAPYMDLDSVPDLTLDRLEAEGRDDEDLVQPYLSEEPWFPLPEMRKVGSDAEIAVEGSEPVPEYFAQRGVLPADEVVVLSESLSVRLGGSPGGRENRRLLRGCDVVLSQPREAADLEADDRGRLYATLRTPLTRSPSIRLQGDRYEAPAEPETLQEQLAASVSDDGIDELKVGTIWLLSPPGANLGSEPDATWTFYAEHDLFTNLNHEVTRDIDVIEPLDLQLDVPLAGGIAQSITDTYLALLNEDDAALSLFLSRGRVQGRFWTC